MTIASTRAALAALLVAGGVRAFDSAPKALPTPCVVVGFPSSYIPHSALGGATAMEIALGLYVGYGDNRAAEDELEALIDTVVGLVEAVAAYSVSDVAEFGLVESASGQPSALSCTVTVSVL